MVVGRLDSVGVGEGPQRGPAVEEVLGELLVVFRCLLVSAVGSTLLGIGLLRGAYRPRLTAWLLTLAFPSLLVVPAFLGNLSLGLVPFLVAWGATGVQLWCAGDRLPTSKLATNAADLHG